MRTISERRPINLKVVRFELDFTPSLPEKVDRPRKPKKIKIPEIRSHVKKRPVVPPPPLLEHKNIQKKSVKELVEELLYDLYADQRDWSSTNGTDYGHGSSTASFASSHSHCGDQTDAMERIYLEDLDMPELRELVSDSESRLQVTGERLARCVRARDRFRREQKRLCAAFTVLLRHITGEPGARFGLTPSGDGEGGYTEWLHAMRLVARLPAGVPQHFRRKLWLTLADRHLTACGVDWPVAERACFRGTAQPEDTELGAQILKDLHRTGCSLFCGTEGRENQAMLRRVLLAYARWNKDVGYCQGFNMLAAIILEVMDKSEADSLKVMIYLVEAVLPEGYFADDLRGLSADMAAFRDLLRLRIPRLAHHMDHLQRISDGGGVEPPLPDVFTMQWFLTLYATWLPRESLLRIWDLVLLDGNEVLLLTALAIWDMLQDRILSARSADEYYSCMGGGAGAVYEAGDALVARVVAYGSAPELPRLRNLHRYKVAPPAPPALPVCQPPLHSAMQSMTKRGLRLFYSEDEGDSSDDGNRMALATVMPRRQERLGAGDRLSLDIGALKRQYARLRERQRQAHVILAAACARHAAVGVPTSPTSLTVNNLLLGKSAIVSSRGRRLGPPPGAVPPSRHTPSTNEKSVRGRNTETIDWVEEKGRKSLSRRNSMKWKDIKKEKALERTRKASIDLDEQGDGIIVSEREANEICASLRSRSSSETSSYSEHSESSSDTSLCDNHDSDSEPDLPEDKKVVAVKSDKIHSPLPVVKESEVTLSPEKKNDLISFESVPKDISDYIETDAGKQLRTYIDGFETMLKDSYTDTEEPNKSITPIPLKTLDLLRTKSPSGEVEVDPKRDEVLERLNKSPFRDHLETTEYARPTRLAKSPKKFTDLSPVKILPQNFTPSNCDTTEYFKASRLSKSPKNFTDLSPIEISPCNFGLGHQSPCDFDFETSIKYPSSSSKPDLSFRPPDIIDSLTMYPNFVPDIDLSDKNTSDLESPSRSPGAESIVVSEDEPPIPLKIDKYFEHSPEFFGARITVTDPKNSDIHSRRPFRRHVRIPKKPDSLTLQSSYNEKLLVRDEGEVRASSLPQSHSFNNKEDERPYKVIEKDDKNETKIDFTVTQKETLDKPQENKESYSPKDYFMRLGRKNSERALQIIQENSKILSRILTKQSLEANKKQDIPKFREVLEKDNEDKLIESPILKESTSDSLIGYRKSNSEDVTSDKNEFVRVRPISIDDPFSLESRNVFAKPEDMLGKNSKSPSTECLVNKTDLYGWENKGFLAKCDYKSLLSRPVVNMDYSFVKKTTEQLSKEDLPEHKSAATTEWIKQSEHLSREELSEAKPASTSEWIRHSEQLIKVELPETKPATTIEWIKQSERLSREELSETEADSTTEKSKHSKQLIKTELPETNYKPTTTIEWTKYSISDDSKPSVTLPSSEPKESSTFERRLTSDDYNHFPLSSKYNDFVLSKASDICSKTADQGPKVCDSVSKTDNSQYSEFAHVVTSSISFTYEPTGEDDSAGAQSNSSDTLCQITSLDQVSTPISPKIFPRDTPSLPKDFSDKSDTKKIESDDTCSAITSLIETENTLSSLSYPRSPSTGSYHPFPTRPAMRLPKELGVRLGMYPKETVSSPPK